MKPKVATVMLSDHGLVAAFDTDGKQIPELQIPFYELWAKHASALGYDLSQASMEMPAKQGLLRQTEAGWRVD
jgi:hypothetical protein